MGLNVLVVPDKFKGTLTAAAAAEAIAAGWRTARPQDALELLPMSDGGDGFGEVMSRLLGAERCWVDTVDAAHQPRQASWWWDARTRTAVLESAQVVGLALLPPGKYHPFNLDTFGLGRAFQAAAEAGAVRCLIGIGGSATNDGGFGLAKSLGWQFLDGKGSAIEAWTQLAGLALVVAPKNAPGARDVVVAVDVDNPLLGERGASRVYGPQKGLREVDFPLAESCLERLAKVAKTHFGQDFSAEPGAGAAGGLGFGLRSFLGARLESGFELFARHANLESRLRASQLVITGEGSIDASTLMGKGVGQVARWCHQFGVPCLGLAGGAELERNQGGFREVFSLAPGLTDAADAKARPGYWLARLAGQIAKDFVLG